MKLVLHFGAKEGPGFLRRNVWRILGVALLALFLQEVVGTHGFLAMRRTQQEIKQIRAEIGKLNAENKSLAGEVNALKTDPKAIERVAREDMGLVRPGELIYKLPDSPPDDSPAPDAPK